jgi:hypothetical protein
MRFLRTVPVAACALLLALTACSGGAGSEPPAVAAISDPTTAEQSLARGDCRPADAPAVPASPGAAVLTVRDSGSSSAGTVSLTMAQLDALPQVECTVDDRIAEGRQARFQGVLLSTLLSHLGAEKATTLSAAALNDYSVDLPMSDITDLPVLLATRLDGKPMSVANYGPLRVIYPTSGYNLDPTVYDPRRIWQLSSIDIR